MEEVGIVVFPGADELDVVGPFRVFTAAQMPVHLIAERPGAIRLGNGLVIHPTHTFEGGPPVDILLVPGGSSDSEEAGRRVEQRNKRTIGFVRRSAKDARITASVCTGAFLLAEAGLLAGRRANTHWMYRDELRALMSERGEPIEIVAERLAGTKARRLIEAGLERETPTG